MQCARKLAAGAVFGIGAWASATGANAATPQAEPGCAWGMHRSDGTSLEGGFGVRRAGDPAPITADTAFDIASISKQFTALAVLQLAADKALDLDDAVRRHLPELPAWFDGVRLRHLVWHTGGVPDYIGPLFEAGRKTAVVSADEVMQVLTATRRPDFESGTRFEYSNSGYFLLARVVERVSGESMAGYAQAHIFGPLGMQDTRIVDRYPNPVQARAHGHVKSADGSFDKVEITWEPTGDGQVFTTVRDLRRWMQALAQGHPAMDAAVLAQMRQRGRLDNGEIQDYGYGLLHAKAGGRDVFLHEGAWSGSTSRMAWSPQGYGGVVLCNHRDADVQGSLDPILQYAAATAEASGTEGKSPDGPGPALPVLGVGHAVGGQLPAGASHVFRLDLPAGHVVQGNFQGGKVVLDLQDQQGAHLRRLSGADAGQRSFMWIASEGQQLAVSNPANELGTFSLTLTRALAPRSGDEAGDKPETLASPRLRALEQHLLSGGNTESFWAEIRRNGAPLIEPVSDTESLVTFLWRGEVDNVRLFGSPSGNHDPLMQLGDSDVWWATYRMPNTARLSYRLAPGVPAVQGSAMDQRRAILATAQRDPFNPDVYPDTADTLVDVYQGASVLTLPQAPPQPWVEPRPEVPQGTLEHRRLDSAELGNQRDVWLYRPANATPQALMVLFDAHAYLEQVPTPVIIDNLVADGLIPPLAVVLVGNPSPEARGEELPPNPRFARFLDKELMPWIADMGLAQPPSRTVIAGSSYGGLASAYAGLKNAHWFGNVLSLSGSYWWVPPGEPPGWMMRQYASAPRAEVRFYLDAGRYEASRGGREGILETSRHLGDVLRAKGYELTRVEHDTGHDYLHWQGSLGCGLVALLNPDRYAQGLAGCAAGIQP